MSQFGEYLRACREALGLTQEQLARKVGVSQATISQYEQGEITPRPRNLVVLATALRRSPDELLARSGYLPFRMPGEREPSPTGSMARHQARPELAGFTEPIQRAAYALFAALQELIAPKHWHEVVLALQRLVSAEGPIRTERTTAETEPQRGTSNLHGAPAAPAARAVAHHDAHAEIAATYASRTEFTERLRVRLGIRESVDPGSRGLDDATDIRSN